MERVKRRWWTWLVSLIAGTVIAGAVLSGAFQLAVLAVPSYRQDLSDWVSEAAGRDVQIDGISLSWRGLMPSFDLTGITLYGDNDADQISVDRVSLGISLRSLMMRQWMPTRLELSGLRVAAEITKDGHIRVAGFEPGDTGEPAFKPGSWVESLNRFEHVELQHCELRVVDGTLEGAPLTLNLDDVELDHAGSGFDVTADLRLPPDRGGDVHLQSSISGAIAQVDTWQGRFTATAKKLQPQGWLRPWLLPGTQVAAQNLELTISGKITDGNLSTAELEYGSEQMVLARAGVLSSAQHTHGVIDIARQTHGWSLDVTDLSLDDHSIARAVLRLDDSGDAGVWDIDADHMDLTRLSPWLGIWRNAPRVLQVLGRSSGSVDGLVLRYRSPVGADDTASYSARARLTGIGLRPDSHIGFAGLSGELTADESGGRLNLEHVPLVLFAPAAIEKPVKFDALTADLNWQHQADGWQLAAENLGWRAGTSDGQGKLQLRLPDKGGVPELSLDATFSVEDVRALLPYMPRHWPQTLQTWLTRGIRQARVPQGELHIQGPLLDFPFHKRPTGHWSLDADVADGQLNYAPGWPALDQLRTHLHFTRNGMTAEVAHAELSGNQVTSATVAIEDFDEHQLTVDAHTQGELARYYDFLRAAPLHKALAGLLDTTQARGPAQADIRLDIPLRQVHDIAYSGTVRFNDAQLQYGKLEPAITGLQGELGFDEHGVTAEKITGTFDGVAVDARIDPEEGTHGVVRGSFGFTPQADGSGPSKFVPAFLRSQLSGTSGWQMELPIGRDGSALTLSSDLLGTAVDLPKPLGKVANLPAPIWIRIGADDQAPLRIALGYDKRVAVDMVLGDGKQAGQLLGLHARTGVVSAPAAKAGEFVLDGPVDRLDVGPWVAFIAGGSSGTDHEFRFDRIDLDAKRLVWLGQSTHPAHLSYRPAADGWQVALSGEGAQGSLRWQNDNGGSLTGRFQELWLETPPSGDSSASEAGEPARDPAALPVADVTIDQLKIADVNFGRVVFASERIAGGQQIRQLGVAGGVATLDAKGAWRRTEGQSSAELSFNLGSDDTGKLLTALGYADSIDAQQSKLGGELRWQPTADGLRWELAQGTINVSAQNGKLRAVDPGASRVLGLINFYALPRRLTLNFNDVVGQGLSFDSIEGSFQLADGNAVTNDLHVGGPSLRMDIRGRVGLLARDYDQRVTVYPDVSAGVTLGAALLGGPALGALVLLAQQLLDKPLDQATQLTYRITGPWDNPTVDKSGATEPAPAK